MTLRRETEVPREHDCPHCRAERASHRSTTWVLTLIAGLAFLAFAISRMENSQSRVERQIERQQCMGYR